MMAKALKILTTLLSSEKGRKTLKSILLFTIAPIITLMLLIVIFGKALGSHNQEMMGFLFDNSTLQSELPNEFDSFFNSLKSTFNEIDDEIKKLDNLKKPLDSIYIKALLMNLVIDNELDLTSNPLNVSEYLKCFYQTETNQADEEIIVPISDTSLILNNCSSFFNINLTSKKETINELYLVALTGRNQELDNYVPMDTLLKDHYLVSENTGFVGNNFTSPFLDNWRKYVTSEFGPRDPIVLPDGTMTSSYHSGIDLARALATSVLAVQKGKVVLVRYTNVGLGFFTVIDHGGGIFSVYGHLSKIHVYENEVVDQGQIIGEVGSTGNSTGPHLHLEIIVHKQRVNPRNYLK